jgi:hypothetical protein
VCCPAVTHSHLDHVGAIEPLKEVYPDLKVIVHETETPYLIGGTDYSCYDYLPKGLSTGFKLLMWLRFIPPFYQYKVGEIDNSWCIQGACGDAGLLGLPAPACRRLSHLITAMKHLVQMYPESAHLVANPWYACTRYMCL